MTSTLRRLAAIAVSTGVCAAALPLMAGSASAGAASGDCPAISAGYEAGDGSVETPYEINVPGQLQYLVETPSDWGANFVLTGNLDMTGDPGLGYCEWDASIGNIAAPFSGTFDGNYYTISNLNITTSAVGDTASAGLFGAISVTATVKELTLGNIDAIAISDQTAYAGTLTGISEGLIQDVSSFNGDVFANSSAADGSAYAPLAGGIVGFNTPTGIINNVNYDGMVAASGAEMVKAGGIAGSNGGSVLSAFSSGPVQATSATGQTSAGGIAGESDGSIESAISEAAVSAQSTTSELDSDRSAYAGGIAGRSVGSGTMGTLRASGAAFAQGHNAFAGGIAGYADDAITSASSSGNTTAIATGASAHTATAGGVIGQMAGGGSLSGALATGAVYASTNNAPDSDAIAGGLIGRATTPAPVLDSGARNSVTAAGTYAGLAGGLIGNNSVEVYSSYAASTVTASANVDVYAGGFFGINSVGGDAISSFWDTQVATGVTAVGSGSEPAGLTGSDTTAMTDITLYSDSLWSIEPAFDALVPWNICRAYNAGYPAPSGAIPATGCTAIFPQAQIIDAYTGVAIGDSTAFTAEYFESAPTYSVTPDLPEGLSLDTDTGVISGTPSTPQAVTNYTISADSISASATALVQIGIAEASLTPAEQSMTGEAGTAVTPSTAFTAVDFTAVPTYSINPELPEGLTMDGDTGVISGTPTSASGPTVYTVTANTREQTASATITIEIVAAPSPPGPGPSPEPAVPASAPLNVAGVAGDGKVTVTWTAPASQGSSAITNYQVASTPEGKTCLVAAPALTCDVTGLTNGTAYTFTVKALNGAGWSPESAASAPVTPTAPPVPPATISVTGDRMGRTAIVQGSTTELAGQIVTPMIRFPGQSNYSEGKSRTVAADGTFTWTRKTNKKVYVYFVVGDVRSDRVIIPGR